MQTNTYCRLCDGACGLVVDLDDNRVSGVRGDPSDPVSEGYSCEVADASVQAVSHPNRVTRPLKREGGELVPCSWDEAISEIGAKLREIRGQSGPASLGLYLGDAVQRSSHSLARALTVGVGLGTPNILSTQCREAAPRIRAAELALGHPVNLLTDLGRAHYVILLSGGQRESSWGQQYPGMAHEQWIQHSRKTKGTKVVVADPKKTELAESVDQHLPIRPGTEAFFLLGMASAILKGGWVDRQYLRDYASGLDELEGMLAPWDVERCADICGLKAAMLSGVALKFSRAAMAVIHPGPGTFQGGNGLVAAWAWMVIHTLTANTLRPGGLYDHRGLIDLHMLWSSLSTDGAPRTRVGDHPLVLLQAPHTALPDEVLTPGEGQLRALLCVEGNPAWDLPESPRAREALRQLELLVCLTRTLDQTTEFADYVLPTTHPWEQRDLHFLDATALPAHFTQLAPALVPVQGEARSPDEILRGLFAEVRPGLRGSVWGRHLAMIGRAAASADLEQWAQRLSEWLGGLDWDTLSEAPHRIHEGDTNRANWRVSHDDNRIDLSPDPMGRLLSDLRAPSPDERFGLWLRTSARVDRAPDAHHRDAVDPGVSAHPDVGIADGAQVKVETAYGSVQATLHHDSRLRPDTIDVPAGYVVDANALLAGARSDAGTGAPEADGLPCQLTAL